MINSEKNSIRKEFTQKEFLFGHLFRPSFGGGEQKRITLGKRF
ncbi:13730_t:CDS:2 [Cetraspora pellucida]|uniref:13730_t:CDS:1 n=1 Tax=Cetraspora pellucida TaxID=1433469 RepID=A0A9N9HEJ4_9GLOM|nr:13730_t:CDS:2 [Cetraspora pellucida]